MVMARKKTAKEKDVLDQMLDTIDFRGLTQDEVAGRNGLIKRLTGRILQRALEAEMTEHLGYEKNSAAGDNSGNSRNGHTEKTVLLETGVRSSRFPSTATGRSSRSSSPSTGNGCRCSTTGSSRCTRSA